jgi:hypothetical protein
VTPFSRQVKKIIIAFTAIQISEKFAYIPDNHGCHVLSGPSNREDKYERKS